jgi:hypothetical protein
MRCSRCGWPGDEATLLSIHHTSEGSVRYRRCICGAVMVELVAHGPLGAQVELVCELPRRDRARACVAHAAT